MSQSDLERIQDIVLWVNSLDYAKNHERPTFSEGRELWENLVHKNGEPTAKELLAKASGKSEDELDEIVEQFYISDEDFLNDKLNIRW